MLIVLIQSPQQPSVVSSVPAVVPVSSASAPASVPNVSGRSIYLLNHGNFVLTRRFCSLPSSHRLLPLFPALPTAQPSLQLPLFAQPAPAAPPLLPSPSLLPQCPRPVPRPPTAPFSQLLPRALPQLLPRALPQLRQLPPTALRRQLLQWVRLPHRPVPRLPTAPFSQPLPWVPRQLRQLAPTAPLRVLPVPLAPLPHLVWSHISPPARPSPPSRARPPASAAPSPWPALLLSPPSSSHRSKSSISLQQKRALDYPTFLLLRLLGKGRMVRIGWTIGLILQVYIGWRGTTMTWKFS